MYLVTDFVSIETMRSLGTVLAFVAFTAICLWAYSSKRRDAFAEAANLPFADDTNAVSREELSSLKENVK